MRIGAAGIAALVGLIVAIMLLLPNDRHFVDERVAGWIGIAAVTVVFAAVAVWPLVWMFDVPQILRGTVFAGGLQPFHELREALASGRLVARRPDGSILSAPLFASPWALTAFSRHEDVRLSRLPGSRRGLADEAQIDVDNDIDERPEVAASLNRVADRLQSVEAALATASQPKTRSTDPKQPHWYATVSGEMHSRRMPDIANRWTGLHVQQVEHALTTAFELTRASSLPTISAKDLAAKVAASLQAAGLPVGLGETDSDSKVWLEKMFGSGVKNDYAFVRRYLTETDYKLPYELPLSS